MTIMKYDYFFSYSTKFRVHCTTAISHPQAQYSHFEQINFQLNELSMFYVTVCLEYVLKPYMSLCERVNKKPWIPCEIDHLYSITHLNLQCMDGFCGILKLFCMIMPTRHNPLFRFWKDWPSKLQKWHLAFVLELSLF